MCYFKKCPAFFFDFLLLEESLLAPPHSSPHSGIKCSGNAVRPPNRASCVNCAAWEMPSEDKASCQLDYVFVVVVPWMSVCFQQTPESLT